MPAAWYMPFDSASTRWPATDAPPAEHPKIITLL
eukprot:COSAG03_NODE_26374_length_259_cov_1.181250_1_plen_33_part_10